MRSTILVILLIESITAVCAKNQQVDEIQPMADEIFQFSPFRNFTSDDVFLKYCVRPLKTKSLKSWYLFDSLIFPVDPFTIFFYSVTIGLFYNESMKLSCTQSDEC